MTKDQAARQLRWAIGKSRTYSVGWLAAGEDEVIQAVRDFDAAWGTTKPSVQGGGER
jgi:uncharacterized membrane protein YhdT